MKLNIAIATYNRQEDLEKCLKSIQKQTLFPQEIVIIDDGNLLQKWVMHIQKEFEHMGIFVKYYKKNHTRERCGLAESKNIALNVASEEIILFLDDDVILEPNFFESIMDVWRIGADEKLLGVGGVIENNRKKSLLENMYNRFFGLTSKFVWDINDIGFQTWDDHIEERIKGYYAHGGVCSYRKDLVKKLGGFEPFSGGRSALEDVEFCMKAKRRGYYFLIEPEAKAVHQKSKLGREGEYLTGWKESVNRKIILQRYCDQAWNNKVRFVWGNIGWILRQFLAGHILKGWGMLNGFFAKKI
ncbi:MAG: hypothetical protein A2748_03430 [Candidatus Wildermuthbacteria bacterium RIFCSPHIGHO2_01_FULL_45_20]|nr:MAG: hypothetical protein A2748_03430 [Candidatus Wildermuthbacteria bacterium RIFCSPHIGHO2_01_FULL_45_20]